MEKLLSLLFILTLECLPLSSNQEEIKTDIVKLPPVRVVEGGTGVLTWRTGLSSPDLVDVNHTVSWLRAETLQILSVGYLVFTHDNRFSITRGWDLVISRLKAGDSGVYECQVVNRVDRTMTRVTRELIVTPGDKFISVEEGLLQRDDPSSVRGNLRGSRVKSNNERDKTLNKLLESPPPAPDLDVLNNGENMSWSALKLPISSVVVMASIIMILGVVRAAASWRQEEDIPAVSGGDRQSQPRGKQGEMSPGHHTSEVILE